MIETRVIPGALPVANVRHLKGRSGVRSANAREGMKGNSRGIYPSVHGFRWNPVPQGRKKASVVADATGPIFIEHSQRFRDCVRITSRMGEWLAGRRNFAGTTDVGPTSPRICFQSHSRLGLEGEFAPEGS